MKGNDDKPKPNPDPDAGQGQGGKRRRGAKLFGIALILPGLIASALGLALFAPAATTLVAQASGGPSCVSGTIMASNEATWTAGWTATSSTETNASSALSSYANYSDGHLVSTYAVQNVPNTWINASSNSSFASSSAEWISTSANFPGDTNNNEGSPQTDQWRLYQNGFSIPSGAVISSATVSFAAAGGVDVYSDGTLIGSTNPNGSDYVYGNAPTSTQSNYNQVVTVPFNPATGVTTMDFVVRNWPASASSTDNPTGLLYNVQVNYCMPSVQPTVTIMKYVNGQPATASSTNNASFAMTSSWNNTSSTTGNGTYSLDAAGANSNGVGYEAVTNPLGVGSSYTTSEVLDGTNIGASCSASGTVPAYALQGYSTGTSMALAASGTVSTTPPNFTNLQGNEYVVVWNTTCPSSTSTPPTGSTTGNLSGNVTGTSPYGNLQVTSIVPVNTTATADGSFTDGWKYIFNITVPTNEPHLALQFSDWTMANTSNTIPVGNDMRVSSSQANNNDATILLTASNTYSSPSFNITGDLDPSTPGDQVQVLVETSVPINTVNGTYSTNYTVQSLP